MGISRSENMRRIRSKDTAPEMTVRRLVHGMGYRYRVHHKGLPGRPDLIFTARSKVIFVHGCFWHQHRECREGRPPKSNEAYWIPKLERNVKRDMASLEQLAALGWNAMIIWECEIADTEALARKVSEFLGAPRRTDF